MELIRRPFSSWPFMTVVVTVILQFFVEMFNLYSFMKTIRINMV